MTQSCTGLDIHRPRGCPRRLLNSRGDSLPSFLLSNSMSRDQLDALGGANPSRALMRWHISCSPECAGSAARPPAARSPPSVGSARPSTASRCACSARPRRFRFSMMFVVRAASAPAAPSPLSTSASAPPSTVSCPIHLVPDVTAASAPAAGSALAAQDPRCRGATAELPPALPAGGAFPEGKMLPERPRVCPGSRRFDRPSRGLSAYDPGRGRSGLFMERGFRPPGMLRFAVSACAHWNL